MRFPLRVVSIKAGLCAAVLLLAASCNAAEKPKGPYLQSLTGNSVDICWETTEAAAGSVAVQPEGGQNFVVNDPTAAKLHQVAVSGLEPGRNFKYSVSSGSFKGGGAFRTDPGKPEPFTFIAYGDSRTGNYLHKQLVKVMKKYDPVLILNTGDLVSDGREQSEWEIFWDIVDPVVNNAVYWPTLGNHEKNADLYYNYFLLPDSGQGERNYAFSYAGAFFIAIDSNGSFGLEGKLKKWLVKELESAQKYDYIFVFFHQPLFSSSKREPAMSLRKRLCPLFEKYGVSAVFHGHDHFYERSERNAIPYIVTGGGGAPLYDFENIIPESKVRVKENHIVVVKIDGGAAKLEARNLSNKIIDSFTVPARAH